ncbi:MAG: cytochrome c3 family protein [Bacteroidota bacterium]
MKRTVLDYALKIRLPLTLFVIIVSFVLTFYISRAERDGIGYAPEQPIKFSHKLHAGQMAIDCQYCHIGVEKGRNAIIPSVNICMNCHSLARKDRPEIIKLTQYYEEGKPIPWKRIHKVPEYAYFNHSVHVNKGIDCVSCHGDIKEMEVVNQAKGFTMTACLDCHRKPHENLPYLKEVKSGPEHCAACHR